MIATTRPALSVSEPTLYVAFELSKKDWKLAMTSGFGVTPWLRTVASGNLCGVVHALQQGRRRFALTAQAPAVSCYEAGRDGFWIHRALTHLGIANRVVDSASIAVDRRARRAKTDRLDALGSYGHGGLIDHGRVRNECMARLLTTIENNHGVTSEQITVARGQRSWLFDLAVELLFLPLFCLGAAAVCLALDRRFSSDQPHVWFLASALSSFAASFIGLQVGELWLAVWEVVRVGNGHISSFRAATWNRWSQQHHGAEVIGGVLLFWIIALFFHWSVSGDEPSTTAPTPQGALLG